MAQREVKRRKGIAGRRIQTQRQYGEWEWEKKETIIDRCQVGTVQIHIHIHILDTYTLQCCSRRVLYAALVARARARARYSLLVTSYSYLGVK
jgi:hypothetical protein